VEEMIKRSFSENSAQKLLPETKRLVDENEQKRSALRQLDCAICEPDLEKFYDVCSEVVYLNRIMMTQFISTTPAGNRTLSTGRIIVINTNVYRNAPAVILKPLPVSTTNSQHRSFYCLVLLPKDTTEAQTANSDEIIPLPITDISVPEGNGVTEIATIGAPDILYVTRSSVKIDAESIMEGTNAIETVRIRQELETFGLEAKKSGVLEFDFSKIKDMEFQEKLRTKVRLMKSLRTEFQCTKCPDLYEHVSILQNAIESKINNSVVWSYSCAQENC
jgi:antiviral helicase SKI2